MGTAIMSMNASCICDFSIGSSSFLNRIYQKEINSRRIQLQTQSSTELMKKRGKKLLAIKSKKSNRKLVLKQRPHHHKSQTLSSGIAIKQIPSEKANTPIIGNCNPLLTLRSLKIEKKLGDSKSNVMLVKDGKQQLYAMKVITHLSKDLLSEYSLSLQKLKTHNFVVPVKNLLYQEGKLYVIMEYLQKGELLKNVFHRLSETAVKTILAEIILGLNYLREQLQEFSRCLSLENILLDKDNHVSICNYGLQQRFNPFSLYQPVSPFCRTGSCGRLSSNEGEENSINKTLNFSENPQLYDKMRYYPPEIFKGIDPNEKSDCWILGFIAYQLVTGKNPYQIENFNMLNEFLNEKNPIEIENKGRFSKEMEEFLQKVFVKSNEERLSLKEIKKLDFFKEINWQKISNKEERGVSFGGSGRKRAHHHRSVLVISEFNK